MVCSIYDGGFQYSLGRSRETSLSPRISGFTTTSIVPVTREKISRFLRDQM